jgi:dephospho-CoA kinase
LLRVGLTGGVACGKSTIAAMLERRGARVIKADEIAHKLMSPGQPVYDAVVEYFGREILKTDDSIDRPKLAALVFPSRVKELNALVHPAVVKYQDDWMEQVGRENPNAVAIVEAALIFEAGAADHFDRMIVVLCSFDQKAERFAPRTGMELSQAREEVRRRSSAQFPDEDKAAQADYIIDNSASLEHVERQVENLWAELQQAK